MRFDEAMRVHGIGNRFQAETQNVPRGYGLFTYHFLQE